MGIFQEVLINGPVLEVVLTRREGQEPNQNFKEGRFSRSVWPHQANGFPLLDLELNIVDSSILCVVVISILNANHMLSFLAK